jgi:hypothetical protein
MAYSEYSGDGRISLLGDGFEVEKSGYEFCSAGGCVGLEELDPDPELGETTIMIGIYDTKPLDRGGERPELVAKATHHDFTAFVALVKAAGAEGTQTDAHTDSVMAVLIPDEKQRSKFDADEQGSFIHGVRDGFFDDYADLEGFRAAGLSFVRDVSGRLVMARLSESGIYEPLASAA